MSESKFGSTLFTILLCLVCFLFFSEIAICIACFVYGFCAAREYTRIGKHVWACSLPSKVQFTESQRLYWQFIQSNLPFGTHPNEAEQWLEEHSGHYFSIRQSLWEGIKKVAFVVVALMIWPCAIIIHGFLLGFMSCRES